MVALGGMHGCSQGVACVVAWGGIHGCWGACVVVPGVCMVAPGGACMVALGGHAWDMMRSGDTVNERAVRILLECILVIFGLHFWLFPEI